MKLLSELVEFLASQVSDIRPVAESDIRTFADEHNLVLRKDHLQFLMRFGREPGRRPEIFRSYGGDFDFETFKRVCLENCLEMEVPNGTTFFGSGFLGDSFCIDQETGQIFVYDEGYRYGLVHERIEGFLLKCLLSVWDGKVFANRLVKLDLESDFIAEFRLKNVSSRLDGASSYEVSYDNIDQPQVFSEYYLIGRQLVALYPPTNSIATFGGGVLERL